MLTMERKVPEAMIVPKSSQGTSCCTGIVLPEASAANRLLVKSMIQIRSIERILNKRFMIATSVAFIYGSIISANCEEKSEEP